MEESLKLYHLEYSISVDKRVEAWGRNAGYDQLRYSTFRVARDPHEARQGFKTRVLPQIISHLRGETDGSGHRGDGSRLYDNVELAWVWISKIDSVQDHRISIEKKVR